MFHKKVTKLWKFVTWATDVEIRNRMHHHEARDSGFCYIPLHVTPVIGNGSDGGQSVWLDSQTFLLR